jgi:hypothetical protein
MIWVNDAALVYGNFCVQDDGLYIPGWTRPADLAKDTWAATGVVLRVEVLPGKKLRGRYVDAAQAQKIAQGQVNEPSAMTKEIYNKAIVSQVYNLFGGSFFGTIKCEDVQRQNPLRKMNLFSVDSLNGYKKISDLLASVTPLATSKTPTPP